MYGHLINVSTHLNVKSPAIGGHLPKADAHSQLLVVGPAKRNSANKCHVFGGSFNQKLLARTITYVRPI